MRDHHITRVVGTLAVRMQFYGFPAKWGKGKSAMNSGWGPNRFEGMRKHPVEVHTYFQWVIICTLIIFGSPRSVYSEHNIDLESMLDLEANKCSIASREDIVRRCSLVLAEKQKHDKTTILKVYKCRAGIYLELKKFELAKHDYEQFLRLMPDEPAAAHGRAAALLGLGLKKEGMTQLKDIIKSNPNYVEAYVTIANLSLANEKSADCIIYCTRALVLNPKLPDGYYTRAIAYMAQRELEKSLTDITSYIELNRGIQEQKALESAYLLRANLHILLKKPEQALPDIAAAKIIAPDSYFVYRTLFSAYHSMQRHRVALHVAEELIRRKPKEPDAYRVHAASLGYLRCYEEAIRSAKNAVTLDEQDVDSHYLLGSLYGLSSQYGESLRQYEIADKLAPERKSAMKMQIMILSSSADKKYRNGRKALELATALRDATGKADKEALIVLAMAQAECGDFTNAATSVKQALALTFPASPVIDDYKHFLGLFTKEKPFRLPAHSSLFSLAPH